MSIKTTLKKALGYRDPAPVIPAAVIPIKKEEDNIIPVEALASFYEDIKLTSQNTPDQGGLVEALKQKPRVATPSRTYQRENALDRNAANRPDRGLTYESAHYDLRELAKARDTESLINTSAEKHVETALQNGFSWRGSDEEILEYFKTRIFEIEIVSQLSMRKVLEMIFDQLTTYGTAFLVVRRDIDRSTGKKIRLFGKNIEPIAAWGVPDSPTMKVAENTLGNVIGWKQEVYESGPLTGSVGKTKFFDPDEVFVFTRHKQAGRIFGRSMYTSTLDDALLLRSMEDLVHVVTQKYAFPLFQYVVGTKEHPATDITLPNGELISEVEVAQSVVENMPVEGGFVTPYRHEIKLIGTEGKVLDMSKYLDHFRTRVQESTRMSNAVLGTGSAESSKSTAQTQVENLRESAKYLQEVVKDGFYWFIFYLMSEGGFDVVPETMVNLDFSASNPEETRAGENHALAKFQADLLTHEEARKEIGKLPLSEEEKNDTCSAHNHKRDMDLAKQAAAAKAANSAAKKSGSSKRSTSSKTRPSNQSGKKATKTKVKKNDYLTSIKNIWQDAKRVSISHIPTNEPSGGFNRVTSPMVDRMAAVSKQFLSRAINEAVADARDDFDDQLLFVNLNQNKQILHHVRQMLKAVMSDCVGSGFKDKDKIWISAAFQAHQSTLMKLSEDLIDYAYRAAYTACMFNAGIEKAQVSGLGMKNSVKINTADYCNRLLLSSEDIGIDPLEDNNEE